MDNVNGMLNEYSEMRRSCIPLISSENFSSPYVRRLLSHDIGNRYYIPQDDSGHNLWDYPQQATISGIHNYTVDLARRLFGGNYVSLSALSGNQCVAGILFGATSIGDCVVGIAKEHGGHWALRTLSQRLGIQVINMPFINDTAEIDLEGLQVIVAKKNPKFIMLDSSHTLFLHPVRQIREIVGNDIPVFYDMSQIMGAIAGRSLANPLDEGATCIHGSTHKSLPGPQKGLLVFKSDEALYKKIEASLHPILASNIHLDHLIALAATFEEMLEFGKDYANKILENGRYLAKCLTDKNIYVPFREKNYTDTHQIWIISENREKALKSFKEFEQAGILLNLVELPFNLGTGFRIGIAEITRLGYTSEDIEELAEIISGIIKGNFNPKEIRDKVKKIALSHQNPMFTFD